MIYHVATIASWDAAKISGTYTATSLFTEGFIHCSTKLQVQGVLQRYYQGQTHLVLLHIDETLLNAELKYENAPSVNQLFPHVFGAINVNAVVNVEKI
jgi:uncharacterized protein (DUF952 family)